MEDSVWWEQQLIVPRIVAAEPPHIDLPEDCRVEYEEARMIANLSPRGAVALLRLVVQKLMPHLGQPGKDLFKDIAHLVKNGLPPQVQMALDACRVIGNNAVHPGEMAFTDSPDVANQLFGLINFIVDDRISRPAALQAIYDSLPDGAKSAIEIRDSTK